MAGKSYTYKEFYPDMHSGLRKQIELLEKINNLHKQTKTITKTGGGLKQTNRIYRESNELQLKSVNIRKNLNKLNAKEYRQRQRNNEALNKKNILQKEELKDKKRLANAEVRYLRAAKGSLEQMRASLVVLKLRHKQMEIGTKREIAYRRKISRTTAALKNQEAAIGVHTRNVGNYGSALKKVGAQMLSFVKTMGIMTAAYAGLRIIKESIQLFQVQEQAVKDNEAVFGLYSETLQDYASDIQKVTTVGDEQTIALTTQARNFGIAVEDVQDATTGAIGLAEKFKKAGLSQETALKGIALAYQGNFSQLERYIPALRNAGTESEKMAILQKEMASGFDLAKEAAKSSGGQIQQMKNSLGDLQETIGENISPTLGKLAIGVKYVADNFDKFKLALQPLLAPFRIFKTLLKGAIEDLEKWGILAKSYGIDIDQIRTRTEYLQEAFSKLSDTQKNKVIKEFNELRQQYREGKLDEMEFADELNKLIIKAETGSLAFGNLSDDIEDTNKQYEIFNETGKSIDRAIKDQTANAYELAHAFENVEKKIIDVGAAQEESTNKNKELYESFYDSIDSILETSINNQEKLLEKGDKRALQRLKLLRILQITTSTIKAVASVIEVFAETKGGLLAKIAAAAAAGAFVFSQVSKLKAQKYYKGTEYLKLGNNPPGRDTVPAMGVDGSNILLSGGERVMTVSQNAAMPRGFPNDLVPAAAHHYVNTFGGGNVEKLLMDQTNFMKNQTYFVPMGKYLIGHKNGRLTGEKIKLNVN